MPDTPPAPEVCQRFGQIMEGLRRTLAAHMARNPAIRPVLWLAWTALGRAASRLAALAARVGAGTLRPPRARQRRRPDPPPPPQPRQPRQRLPQRRAWLIRLVGWQAAGYGSQLRHLLEDPEMAALIAAAPQAGRILRPLCRMLGVPPGPALTLPPRALPPGTPPPRARPPRKPRSRPAPARPAAKTVRTRQIPPERTGPPSVEEICALAGVPPPARA